MNRPLRLAAGLAFVLVLLSVFAWYLQPQMVFDLATRVWSCF